MRQTTGACVVLAVALTTLSCDLGSSRESRLLEQEIEDLEWETRHGRQLEKRLPALEEEIGKLISQNAQLETITPTDPATAELLLLTHLKRAGFVDVVMEKPEVTRLTGHDRLRFECTARTDFDEVHEQMKILERATLLLQPERLALRDRPEGLGFDVDLSLSVFVVTTVEATQ